ncbi:MAG TPA: TolC family protein [Chitinispirillaceae bacterium]|nr:TolC family protein [Chitinispirillaceae bacterium]
MNKLNSQSMIWGLLCMYILTIFTQNIYSLTLQGAVSAGVQNNQKISQYNERIRGKTYEEKNAIGNLAPAISLHAGYTYMDEPLTMSLDPIRDAMISLQARDQVQFANIQSQMKGGPAIDNPSSVMYQSVYKTAYGALDKAIPHFIDTLKEQDFPSLSVTAVQPIFTGGKIIAGIRAAHLDKEVAVSELKKVRNEVTFEIVNYYLAAVFVHDVIQVRRDVLSAMEKHQQKAAKLSEQGMIARYHLLRADVAVSEAKRNLTKDCNNYEIACLALRKSMNDTAVNIDKLQSLMYLPVNDSLELFLQEAMKGQPIFEILHGKQAMVKEKIKVQVAGFMPQVAAFGKYEVFTEYLSALEPDWTVGVTATLPVFNGLKNVTSLQAARSLEKELKYVQSGAEDDVRLWVKKAFKEMRNNEERYKLLDSDLKLAEENLRQCKSRFDNGYGTSLEVVDAQLVLEKNRIERLTTVHDYCKSFLDLTMAGGKPEQFLTWFSTEEVQ